MVVFETEVLDVIPRTHNVKSFRFKLDKEENFKPGQFFFVSIKIAGQERTKHFSFSNSPTEKGYIEFTKRITDSEFSQSLDRIKKDDWAKIKMPMGSFTFEGEHERIAFLSGGIGITPIKSICKFATDKKLTTNIVLLYGNNSEEDIIFREDLDALAKENKNFRVIYTLTASDKKNSPGRLGLIDAEMIKQEIPDYAKRVFYICGPPKMVESLSQTLRNELLVKTDKIKIENFTGY